MQTSKISRRSVLKMLGMGAAAVTAAGVSGTLAACDPQRGGKRDRLVFYFSATGNSLWAARELAQGGEVRPIPQELKHEGELHYKAAEIGIVYPKIGKIPAIVSDWLSQVTLECDYLFAVVTCGHGVRQDSLEALQGLLNKSKLSYFNLLKVADNRSFKFDLAQEIKQMNHKQIAADLAAIVADLDSRKASLPNLPAGKPHPGSNSVRRADELFTISENCIGCGICVDVCPRGDFKIEKDMAVCQGVCENCQACVHSCPQHAIVPVAGDKNPKVRYRNPHVSLRQLQEANHARDVMLGLT